MMTPALFAFTLPGKATCLPGMPVIVGFRPFPVAAPHVAPRCKRQAALKPKGEGDPMRTVKAAVCRAFGAPLVIEEIRLAPPGPGQVQVDLSACAICHSDISYAEGAWGGHLPAVYGHEAAGVVSALGEGVEGLAVGDSVLVTLMHHCGRCPSCAGGAPVHCEVPVDRLSGVLADTSGAVVEHGLNCGAFAEAVVVHHSQAVPVPADLPPDAACLLSCGVVTGVGAAVNTAQVRPGETVVVIGAGGVGLNAVQGARIAGAARIVAVDMSAEKLDAAREFGATHGVLATDPKPWRAVQEVNHGRLADVVLVTVGAIPAYETAPRYLARHGRLAMVGMPHSGGKVAYEPVIVASLGQQMLGSLMGDVQPVRDIGWMVELYRQGRLKLDELVSGRWRLDQINEAIADTKAGGARRNVVVFR